MADYNTKLSATSADADDESLGELAFLRDLIDNTDSAILSILAHRARIISYIIQYKAAHNIQYSQSQTRKEAICQLLEFCDNLDIDKDFVAKLLANLFNSSHSFLNMPNTKQTTAYLIKNPHALDELNRTLKHLDMSFCCLLSERMQLVKQIGEFKHIHHMAPLAQQRWEQVLKTKMAMAVHLNLNPEAIREFYNLIHEESLRIEKQISP